MTHKLTDVAIQRAIELRGKGWSIKDIAKDAGVHPGSIYHHFRLLCVLPPKLLHSKTRSQSEYMRGGKPVRPYKPTDDESIQMLSGMGVSISEIARRLGRSASSVRNRLITLAFQQGRSEAIK